MLRVITIINLLVTISGTVLNNSECSASQIVFNSEGHVKIVLILNGCSTFSPISRTYSNLAIWTIERLNELNFTAPLRLGLSIFQACTDDDYYDPIYKSFKQDNGDFSVGVVLNHEIPNRIRQFAEILGVRVDFTDPFRAPLMETTMKLLGALELQENITMYSDDFDFIQEFYKATREEFMCVKTAAMIDRRKKKLVLPEDGPIVVYGGDENLQELLTNLIPSLKEQRPMIFIPYQGSENNDFPEGSYIIQPLYSENDFDENSTTRFVPSPLLFDVANSILNFASNISNFVNENCNESLYKLNCLRNKYPNFATHHHLNFSPGQILNLLKIENLADTFLYQVLRVENITAENSSMVNVFSYSIFNKTLINLEVDGEEGYSPIKSCSGCESRCVNFAKNSTTRTILISYVLARFGLRSESWVFAFLAISLLGVLFSLAVLIFLIVRFCKRDILEGNPFLTILLLVSVMLMYSSIIPFTLDSDKEFKNFICLARSLSTTLTYAFAFSLILSRSILLATISKEVGFMSHIPGPVQAFLTLFIFGIQGALSLQFLSHCELVFRGMSFVYLLSYNIILLVLLVFICPLNTRVQRNYKEGKHFMVAVVLLACTWSCWVPGYAVLEEEWKDPILCLGLVATASILLGAIFIPRTYMMTIAAARNRMTNVLPSLPTTSSIMDVYRASTQPVYDCINVAAINAAAIGRNNIPPPPPQPQIYSSLAAPFDDEFDFERSITPNHQDKITRF